MHTGISLLPISSLQTVDNLKLDKYRSTYRVCNNSAGILDKAFVNQERVSMNYKLSTWEEILVRFSLVTSPWFDSNTQTPGLLPSSVIHMCALDFKRESIEFASILILILILIIFTY